MRATPRVSLAQATAICIEGVPAPIRSHRCVVATEPTWKGKKKKNAESNCVSNVLIVKSFVVAHAGRLRVDLQNKPPLVTAALRRDTTAQLLWQTSAARRTTAVCQTGRSPSRAIVDAADFWNLRQRLLASRKCEF